MPKMSMFINLLKSVSESWKTHEKWENKQNVLENDLNSPKLHNTVELEV